jgi:hypothetical protein
MALLSHSLAATAKTSSCYSSDFVCVFKCLFIFGQELINVFILGLVLWRYRSLIPFMFLMIIAEQLLRMGAGALHPLNADFYEHRPPGGILNLPMLTLAFVMFFLSLRETKAKPSA